LSTARETTDFDALFASWTTLPPSREDLAAALRTHDPGQAARIAQCWHAKNLSSLAGWPAAQRIELALAGYSSLQYVEPFLTAAALADGLVPRVALGGYNQLIQDLSQPESGIGAAADLLWIWSRIEDLLPHEFVSAPARMASPEGLNAIDAALDLVGRLLRRYREGSTAVILVNDFVPARRSPFGIAEGRLPLGFSAVYQRANDRLREILQSVDSAYVFDFSHQLLQVGLERAVDPRLQLMADCLYRPEFLFRVSQGLRPYLRALRGIARKVLVLDLDNTLWGGVVGEAGAEGIAIGSDPVGKAHAQFQAAVLELYDRGVILALNSKNNPEDVKEVFEKRGDMLLRPEHFASMLINWQDKASNCRKIAEEINVGLDSLVFWDDNPAEREAMRQFLPEICTVEPPRDISGWAEMLRNLDLFDTLTLSAEDAQRGKMYAEDRQRRVARETTFDLVSFLQSLQLKVTCAPASRENMARISSLLSRTNQFNLTTRRHSEEVIRRWSADPAYSIMSFSAEDRFGSYGIVGVAILVRQHDAAFLDSFLLSCRAMGKGIEEVMLAMAGRQAESWGVHRLRASFVPTKKNAPARAFLPNHGFSETGTREGVIEYVFDLLHGSLPEAKHVQVEMSEFSLGANAI
jgi:FkbH-like protein